MLSRKRLIITCIIVLFIEIIFNLNGILYKLNNYKELKINNSDLIVKDLVLDNNKFIVTGNNPTIEIKNINKKVGNIYYSFSKKIRVNIHYTDEMFSGYDRVDSEIETNKRKGINICHFFGKLENVKFKLNKVNGDYFKINDIILNKKINIIIDFKRVSILFLIVYLLLSVCIYDYKYKYKEKDKIQNYLTKLVILIFIMLTTTIFIMDVKTNYSNISFDKGINNIYSIYLTNAILKGNTYINYPVSNKLKELKNPYDYSLRSTIGNEYLWDTAYYKGKYYVYFGILPSLFLFIPFKIITGKYLSISVVVLIFQILSIIFMEKFYKLLINKYFKNIPFVLYLFGLIFFILSSRIINNLTVFSTYNMISIIAYYLIIQGLYYIYKFDKENKDKYLLFGSLSLACSVACRPTMLFITLLILPIIKNKIKLNKKNLKRILLFLLPYVIVGITLMIYNYIRFENILEFGFKYQLTVTDSRKYMHNYYNIIIGYYYYLLAPLKLINHFPFLEEIRLTNYFGFCYNEPIRYSIMTTIIPIVLFFIPSFYKKIKNNKSLWSLIRNMLILGLFLIGIETLLAGIVYRYMLDFAFLFNLASIMIIFYIYDEIIKNKEVKKNYCRIISFLMIISFVIQFVLIYW